MDFEAVPADVEELSEGDPREVALENARRKARAVESELVLGVDTIVAVDDRILPKPRDADQAREWLESLSGRTHQVVSGLCVLDRGQAREAAETTEVTFRELAPADIEWYLGSGEWEGKAGAYAIQGRGGALVERIGGDYLNVVGLPVSALIGLVPGLLRAGPPADS